MEEYENNAIQTLRDYIDNLERTIKEKALSLVKDQGRSCVTASDLQKAIQELNLPTK